MRISNISNYFNNYQNAKNQKNISFGKYRDDEARKRGQAALKQNAQTYAKYMPDIFEKCEYVDFYIDKEDDKLKAKVDKEYLEEKGCYFALQLEVEDGDVDDVEVKDHTYNIASGISDANSRLAGYKPKYTQTPDHGNYAAMRAEEEAYH